MLVETVDSIGSEYHDDRRVEVRKTGTQTACGEVGVKAREGRNLSWEAASACGRSRTGVTPWNTTVYTCVQCRLKNDCLDDALKSEIRGRVVMGVAGGLTQSERRSVLRLAASKGITLGLLDG